MIIACSILLVLDFVVLLFSRLLYTYFDSPIMSTWSPEIPFIIFWVLVFIILITWQVRKAKRKKETSEIFGIIITVTVVVIFFFLSTWLLMREGFHIYDIQKETKYVNNEVIVLFKVDGMPFAKPFVIVGKPLPLGFMKIRNRYYRFIENDEFELSYQKMGHTLPYQE